MFVWQAHKGKVRAIAFSPDGTALVTASGSARSVSLWNPLTGELIRKLDLGVRDRDAQSVAFAPDAPLLAVGMSGSVRVWDTVNWNELAILIGRDRKGSDGFYELAFGRGPNPRLAAGTASRVSVWNDSGRSFATALRAPDVEFAIANVPCLDFSPDGSLLATNVLARAELWDPATGKLVRPVPHTHSTHHGPIKFSPDGTRLAVGYRKLVSIYPLSQEGGAQVTCTGHTKLVWSACWSADGRTLLTASGDGTARLWEPTSGAELKMFEWGVGEIRTAAFSTDGLLGAVGGTDGKVVVWDIDV
ncbi:het-r : HET-R (Fragment) OS=Podospora anserina GN=het-r PE=4 SV=1: WD40: WD40: WD40: WD40 [Gemmata massiliana]|uniref:Uncharacterized protein n=1 Tax=Gemmata massiliana TaxID=1210884 RepID=A0A6P2DN64_9BACT